MTNKAGKSTKISFNSKTEILSKDLTIQKELNSEKIAYLLYNLKSVQAGERILIKTTKNDNSDELKNIVSNCFKDLKQGRDQSIILTGFTSSGKTTTFQNIAQLLSKITRQGHKKSKNISPIQRKTSR